MEYIFSDKIASLKPSAIREIFKFASDPRVISLSAGNPAPESFPVAELSNLSAEIFSNTPVEALQYSITEGYTPLRVKVAERLKNKFNIGRDFDDTIIVSGGQQGLDLSCKVLCNEGDTVLCENPSFIGALNAFRSYNVNLKGVDIDEDGINIEALEKALQTEKNVKMLYVIPTFQNPSGVTMSLEKRKAVYALAKKYNVIILEDNPYGELRFKGEDILPIKSFDEDGLVIYCGSFSKILSAGMRVGFVCAPKEIVQKIVVAKQTNDVHTNIFFQLLTNNYLENYDLDAHIEKIRGIYLEKSTFMLDMIDLYFDKRVITTRPDGGIFLWCTLPEGCDGVAFAKKAIENFVAVVPGSAFNADEAAPTKTFRLNFSTPSTVQIEKGIGILGKVIKEFI